MSGSARRRLPLPALAALLATAAALGWDATTPAAASAAPGAAAQKAGRTALLCRPRGSRPAAPAIRAASPLRARRTGAAALRPPPLTPGAIFGVGLFAAGAVPAARVGLASSPGLQVPMTNGSRLSWNRKEFDVGNLFELGEPEQLTAPSAGIYEVSANVQVVYTDGNPEGQIRLLRNGAPQPLGAAGWLMDPSAPVGTGPALSATAIASLAAGDGVAVEWSSPNPNTVAAAGSSSLSMHWVGPPPAAP